MYTVCLYCPLTHIFIKDHNNIDTAVWHVPWWFFSMARAHNLAAMGCEACGYKGWDVPGKQAGLGCADKYRWGSWYL